MSSFVVQLTPLIRPDAALEEADCVAVTQFEDVNVGDLLNGYKTASVKLHTSNPALGHAVTNDRLPFSFALRVLYEDREEPVFHGPTNIAVDYGARTVELNAQDPSLRMLHHYVRRGDDALNDIPELDKGTIDADPSGIADIVAAAQNVDTQDARNDPSLGLDMSSERVATFRTSPIIIERFQECWQIIHDVSEQTFGPDFNMETAFSLPADFYAYLATYDNLGTDRTSATPDAPGAGEVVLDYNIGANNLADFREQPGRPTTHTHNYSSDLKFRRTAGDPDASNLFGPYVDAIAQDLQFPDGDDDALQELADARVAAYGMPPKFMEVLLRPDAVIGHSYGHPDFVRPGGTRAPTMYMGDRITLRAVADECSYFGPARIVGVNLTQPGPRGPAVTVLRLVPTVGGNPLDEES